MENFAYGEISERSFSNPRPWSHVRKGKAKTDRMACGGKMSTNKQRVFTPGHQG